MGNLVIFSDSKAALQTIENRDSALDLPLINQIIMLSDDRHCRGGHTTISWIPAHCGIPENERADSLARLGLQNANKYSSLHNKHIRKAIAAATSNLSHKFKPLPWNKRIPRALETQYLRLCVDRLYTRELLFKFKKIDSPKCENCSSGVPETSHHILWECSDLKRERDALFLGLHEIGIQAPFGPFSLSVFEDTKNKQTSKMKAIAHFLAARKGSSDL